MNSDSKKILLLVGKMSYIYTETSSQIRVRDG